MSNRNPTHRLKFLNKRTEETGEIGAAWLNEDGSLSLVLNPMVVLRQSPDLVITLFPRDGKFRWGVREKNRNPEPEPPPPAG